MRHAVAVVLVGVAALLLAAVTSLAYGLSVEYGADVLQDGGQVPLVLVPAGLALLCLVGALPVGRRRPRVPVLALGVLVVFAATVSGAAAYGASVHERDRDVRTTACSPDDRALLASVDAAGPRSEVMGDELGACSVIVHGEPDVARATAAVVAGLERGGWQRTGSEGEVQVFQREDSVLRVSAASDGKVTDVRLTLP